MTWLCFQFPRAVISTMAYGSSHRNLQAVHVTQEKHSEQRRHPTHLQFTSAQGQDGTKGKFSHCPQEGRPVCSASADPREEGGRQMTSLGELVGKAQIFSAG